ncbi:MAG TPA: FAD-binding oxidoreductase [Solirubrobacteraceae bacterium]|nr:FAD-binding oxidoreductase [Solirubrobacteraceae bacterium]
MAISLATDVPELVATELADTFRGTITGPSDPGYDDARAVYNGMIDRRPGLIARCADVADVITAVNAARRHDLLVAVRGGGHNAGGLGVCDGGLVIDLSAMRGIHVDPTLRTVRVEGGCTWGDVDHATHAFGLAVPSGIISTTGVGGLTLGGGLGHLSRRHGLTIDSLLAADVVLADGTLVTASEEQNPELFWALRGGGGNFGVVTSFVFRAHPVAEIIGGPTLWTMDRAAEVLRFYDEFMKTAPRDLNGFFAFLTVPPAPPFPEELHLKKMCGVVWCYTGPPEEADAIFAPIAEFGPPALHGVQAMPFPALQSAFDALYPRGHQWYWKADFVDELSDEAIERHVRHGAALPTLQSTMHLYPIDGAAGDPAPNATAFRYRGSRYGMVIVGVDPDPGLKPELVSWARAYWEAVHPYSAGGAYVNMMMHDEGEDRVRASYGDNYDQLLAAKRRYDPDNRFRVNQNISP